MIVYGCQQMSRALGANLVLARRLIRLQRVSSLGLEFSKAESDQIHSFGDRVSSLMVLLEKRTKGSSIWSTTTLRLQREYM